MKMLNKLMDKICGRLYSAIVSRNISELKTETGSIMFRLVDDYSMNNLKELREEIEKYQKWINAVSGTFDTEEEKIAYQMGLLGGTVAAVTQLKEYQEQTEEYEKASFDTKYQEGIIEQLIGEDYIQHNQLAKNLNISPSQLSTIMNKLDDGRQNIISMSRMGKFKYYCLTDMGKRYYYNKNKGGFRNEISELLQCVLDAQKKTNSVIHFVDKYYHDDLELKQKASKVDLLIQAVFECRNNGVVFLTWNDTDMESCPDRSYTSAFGRDNLPKDDAADNLMVLQGSLLR